MLAMSRPLILTRVTLYLFLMVTSSILLFHLFSLASTVSITAYPRDLDGGVRTSHHDDDGSREEGYGGHAGSRISEELFADLEELSRLVDIAYCVGTTGIQRPFLCASRCQDFPGVELVTTWNTGPLLSDSCGYIAVDHGFSTYSPISSSQQPSTSSRDVNTNNVILSRSRKKKTKKRKGRIIVAFRGTYSLANTIVDLSTLPQPYVPYKPPKRGDQDQGHGQGHTQHLQQPRPGAQVPLKGDDNTAEDTEHLPKSNDNRHDKEECHGCKVHTGFLFSWYEAQKTILPHLKALHDPSSSSFSTSEYELVLVGHSLGGAIAALAALEIRLRWPDWKVTVTTFGEPRVGNEEFVRFLDSTLGLDAGESVSGNQVEQGKGKQEEEWRGDWDGDDSGGSNNNDDGQAATDKTSSMITAAGTDTQQPYRRVTHKGDPVPLLPLEALGYRSHAGEIYIAKQDLPPSAADIRHCSGDDDGKCIAGSTFFPFFPSSESSNPSPSSSSSCPSLSSSHFSSSSVPLSSPSRSSSYPSSSCVSIFSSSSSSPPYQSSSSISPFSISSSSSSSFLNLPLPVPIPGQGILAHRDYFHRLGVCLPGGDPTDHTLSHCLGRCLNLGPRLSRCLGLGPGR